MLFRSARQGDVLLKRIDKVPKGKEEKWDGQIILAEGEATGHAHSVVVAEPKTKMMVIVSDSGKRYLCVEGGPAVLTHQEHGKIAIDPGSYEVTRQREWTDEDEPRQVRD